MPRTRRHVLAAAGIAVAGCLGEDRDDGPDGSAGDGGDATDGGDTTDGEAAQPDSDGDDGEEPSAAPADWPQYRRDRRKTGHAGAVAVGEGDLAHRWDFITRGAVRSTPAVDGADCYVGSDSGVLIALGTERGRRHWTVTTNRPLSASPALDADRVYLGAQDGRTLAVDRGTGTVDWTVDTGAVTGSPTIAGDAIYVGDEFGHLYRLGAEDGRRLWRYDARGGGGTGSFVRTSPAVTDDRAYAVATSDGGRAVLHAVALPGGGGRWTQSLGNTNNRRTPAVRDGTVYVPSAEAIHAIGTAGGRRWRFEHPDVASFTTDLAVDTDHVYAGTADGTMYAIDREDGSRSWTTAVGDAIRSTPTVTDDAVVFGSDGGRLVVLGAEEGSERGALDLGTPLRGSPAVVDDRIYVGAEDTNVYAVGVDGSGG